MHSDNPLLLPSSPPVLPPSRALVTGATGYIGSHLAARLLDLGWQVFLLSRRIPSPLPPPLQPHAARLLWLPTDGSLPSLQNAVALASPTFVFHLASLAKLTHTSEEIPAFLQANLTFGSLLLQALQASPCKVFVNTGSFAEYAPDGSYHPDSFYAATKRAFHDLLTYFCRTSDLKALSLILYDVYGPHDERPKMLPNLVRHLRSGQPFPMTEGKQSLDLVWIEDVVAGYLRAASLLAASPCPLEENKTQAPWLFSLPAHEAFPLRVIVERLIELSGLPSPVRWGALPYRPTQIFEPTHALPILPGWSPQTSLTSGLSRLLQETPEAKDSGKNPPPSSPLPTPRKLISILIPVLNEEENVERAVERVFAAMDGEKERYEVEILFTDNHSTDRTWEVLQALAQKEPRVRAYRFSRNFGFQKSIYTLYCKARGDAAIQIDCDLQDPPELLPTFLRRWEAGSKVVYGVRRSRKEGIWITAARKVFYRLIDALSEDDLPHDSGDFRLVDRCILEEIKKLRDTDVYLRGRIATMGFQQEGVSYDRDARLYGESKFNLSKLVRLAFDGIVSHSIQPLRLATGLGLVCMFVSFGSIFLYTLMKLFFEIPWPPGWATQVILLFVIVGLNGFFLGILGEYVARIYRQMKISHETIIEEELPKKLETPITSVHPPLPLPPIERETDVHPL